MAPPVVNPLDMPCIIEKVLDYVEPSLLQPCRLVNRTWNQLTTSRMRKADWALNLTSERLKEYLRILEATERNRGGATEQSELSERSRMELRLHLKISTDSWGMRELDTIIKIVRLPEAPKIVSLELEYVQARRTSVPIAFEENRARLDELFTLIGASLRQLTIQLNSGHNMDWILSYLPEQPNVFCPNLEAISVEYTNTSMAKLVPQVIEQVVRHANQRNLRRLNLFPNGNIASLTSTVEGDSFGVHTATLLNLANCHRLRLSLTELNLHLEGLLNIPQFVTLCFYQLRILRVTSALTDDVLSFVRTNCPLLHTLEFVDTYSGPEEFQELPNITQLGFYCAYNPRLDTHRRVNSFCWLALPTLEKCPNVTTVNTNFITWVELTNWFTNKYGNANLEVLQDYVFIPACLNRVFPTVSTLRIDAPKSSVFSDPDNRRVHIISFFIRRMFPNLNKLVIDLDSAIEAHHPWGRLSYILGLVFRVPSLKHVEMKNMDNQWYLSPPMPLQLGAAVVPLAPPSTMESLTIQAASKSYDRGAATDSHHDADASSPKLDLDSLLSALPAQCPALVLRIDVRLLLNFRKYDDTDYEHQMPIYPYRPYEVLVEDLKVRTNPRIQLV